MTSMTEKEEENKDRYSSLSVDSTKIITEKENIDLRLDYVLVYRTSIKNDLEKYTKITDFVTRIENIGLKKIYEKDEFQLNKSYIYIHCPLDLAAKKAENLKMNLLYKKSNTDMFSEGFINRYSSKDVFLPFNMELWEKTSNVEITESLFTKCQLSAITLMIMKSTPYGENTNFEYEIDHLMKTGIISDMFYPHMSLSEDTPNNLRKFLRKNWASRTKIFKKQPLNCIREYFGETIAVYFDWLANYNFWLSFPTYFGLLVIIFGISTLHHPLNKVGLDACTNNTSSLHTKCKGLKDDCYLYMASHLVDNLLTSIFGVLLCIWGICFNIMWKRKEHLMRYRWGSDEYSLEVEPPLPEYVKKATQRMKNEMTQNIEPYFPIEITHRRSVISKLVFIANIFHVCLAAISEYYLFLYINRELTNHIHDGFMVNLISQVIVSVISFFYFFVSQGMYDKLSASLTKWENFRTEYEYSKNYSIKRSTFYFCGLFVPMIIYCLLMERFVDSSQGLNKLNNIMSVNISFRTYGNFVILSKSIMIMILTSVLQCSISGYIPNLIRHLNRCVSSISQYSKFKKVSFLWEDLNMPKFEGIDKEYQEMVCQFGIVVMFSALFPLTPIIALINNIFEIKSDAKKLIFDFRRPEFKRNNELKAWTVLLDVIVISSIFTNGFIIAFNSDLFSKLLYAFKYSSDISFDGYLEFILTQEGSSNDITCGKEFGNSTKHQLFYRELMFYRVIFLLAFQNLMLLIKLLVEYLFCFSDESRNDLLRHATYMAKMAPKKKTEL